MCWRVGGFLHMETVFWNMLFFCFLYCHWKGWPGRRSTMGWFHQTLLQRLGFWGTDASSFRNGHGMLRTSSHVWRRFAEACGAKHWRGFCMQLGNLVFLKLAGKSYLPNTKLDLQR